MSNPSRGRRWSETDKALLLELAASGIGSVAVAEALGRSRSSVQSMASHLRVSLRSRDADGRATYRAGAVLGAPRDPAYRRAVLDGLIDAEEAERRIRDATRGVRAQRLCVACGSRPARSARTRLCEECAEEVRTAEDAAADARRVRWRIDYHARELVRLTATLERMED